MYLVNVGKSVETTLAGQMLTEALLVTSHGPMQVPAVTSRRCDRGIAHHGCGHIAPVNVRDVRCRGTVPLPGHRDIRVFTTFRSAISIGIPSVV